MSVWRSHLPVICKVQGYAIAGGSDIALCADLLVMGQNAKIGYPPARVWGCPTTAMWVYRLGVERAKRMLLSGDLIDGLQAERWGLGQAVPESELDTEVENLAQRMVTIPRNQLVMQKLMVKIRHTVKPELEDLREPVGHKPNWRSARIGNHFFEK